MNKWNLCFSVFLWYILNMLTEFILSKLKLAKYKLLKDGTYFGEISGLKGVWANGKNLKVCKKELQEVLEDWLFLKVRNQEKVSGSSFKSV